MKTPASLGDHPLHPMLIALPIGFFSFSVLSDFISRYGDDPSWALMARRLLAGGLISGLVAAMPGFIDWLTLDGEARRIGLLHMGANLSALLLFAVSFLLRWTGDFRASLPFGLSLIAFAILGLGGYLGGTLVYKHRVAVKEADSQRML